MKTFDRPGGKRLIPEPDRLAEADSFQAFSELWKQAQEVLDELEQLDHKLREAYRERRRCALRIERLQSKVGSDGFATWDAERQREAERALEEVRERHGQLNERVDRLEEERKELARYIDRNFVGVPTDRDWPDLRPPDEEEVAAQVGKPVLTCPRSLYHSV